MAEQKTEDTNAPLARRGARPFAGPVGAQGAARPFLRPASPAQRPAPASFAPRPAGTRPALGTQTAPPPASPVPSPVEAASSNVEPAAAAGEQVASALDMTIAPSETVAAGEIAAPEPPSLPVTSEMVALDAIDAFDAMWASAGGAVPDELTEQATPESTDVSPLDESSLGSLEGASIWSNDITEASEQLATPAPGAVAPALDLPAWLADDHDPEASAPALEAEAPGTLGGDASRAAESPSEFTPAWLEAPEIVEPPPAPTIGSIAMTEREALENDRLPSEPVDEAPSTVARAPAAALRELPGAHVSAALTRLAERIRVGEIDVSSTAPDASDAAMLAAVLAVLLGGSSR